MTQFNAHVPITKYTARVYDSVDIRKPSKHGSKAYLWQLQNCANLLMFGTFLLQKLMESVDLMVGFSSGLPGKFASMV